MATSMAAAIAASMPAAQTAPAPAIPPSMSKVIDIEGEIPITTVQLDALVVTKIVKHSSEAHPTSALGLLIGIDLDGTLEISNVFPLPSTNDDEDKSTKALARYQASMLRSLKEVQADDAVVGFYQSNSLGAFFRQSLLDLQVVHQDRLRHGGVVVVHDASQASHGNAAFRAFRLSKTFLHAYRTGKFNTQSLIDHKLTFSSIVDEIPLRIRTNPLLNAFLNKLTKPSSPSTSPASSSSAALPPSFSPLDLNSVPLTQNLSQVLDALDDYKTEEGNLAYHARQAGREKARAEAHMQKRREENALRTSQGLAPLPEDDVSRLFKIPPEPSRLESILLLGQIDAYSKSLAEGASVGLVKMYAANANSSV
ncbi:translation initiation factor 3 subunit 3 [Phellopilus nigrolimitatus]|nr:translation initiation factor 3 subunit 3 [Phellopilus nigrolimitatus]